MKKILSLVTIVALSSIAQADHHGEKATQPVGWTNLFDGKTLKGWTQKNGTATYVAKDGTIHGTTKKGSPNSFLCSDKEYGDFELQFDVKVDNALNSGVQLRSQTHREPQQTLAPMEPLPHRLQRPTHPDLDQRPARLRSH